MLDGALVVADVECLVANLLVPISLAGSRGAAVTGESQTDQEKAAGEGSAADAVARQGAARVERTSSIVVGKITRAPWNTPEPRCRYK